MKFYLGMILLLFTLATNGKEGYKIQITIKNNTDTISYLACYYGDKVISVDTAYFNKDHIEFTGTSKLASGVYILIGQKRNKVLEFVVGQDQYFGIVTDTLHPVAHAKIKGSNDNELFFNYIRYTKNQFEKVNPLKQKLKNKNLGADTIQAIQKLIKQLNEEAVNYKMEFIRQHPKHLLSLVFSMIKEVKPLQKNGKPLENSDSVAAYHYYKNNYWGEISLSDARLLRTPVFYSKLNRYFESVIHRNPDSIIVEIDKILLESKNSDELYEYLVWYFVDKYDNHKFMGYDKIFVHLAEGCFINDSSLKVSPSVRQSIVDRAQRIKPLLLESYAPNMILLDTNHGFVSLYQIEAEYTIVLFWDYDCGVCGKEIEILAQLQDTTGLDLRIYAVCADTNINKWISYIREKQLNWVHVNGTRSITKDYHELYDIYGTPVIYVLDRNKKIIAKRISAGQLGPFLNHYQQRKQQN